MQGWKHSQAPGQDASDSLRSSLCRGQNGPAEVASLWQADRAARRSALHAWRGCTPGAPVAPASRRSPAEQPPRARRAAGAAARRGRGGKAETPAAGLAVQARGVGRTSNSLGGTYCSASRLAFLLRWRCRKGGSRGPVPREARCCNRGFIAPLHLSALAEKTVTHIGGEAGSAQEQKADAHGAARLAAKPSRGGSGRHNRRWSGTAPQLCPLGRRRLLCCATKYWPCWPAAPRSQATHPAGRRCAGMPGGRDAALLALSLHRPPLVCFQQRVDHPRPAGRRRPS
jgi:hypothetical protein